MGVISNGTTLLDAGALDSGVATGAMTLIKTLTASSSGTLSFVDGASGVVLDNTYKEYIFKFIDIHPSADDSNIQFQRTDGLFFNIASDNVVIRCEGIDLSMQILDNIKQYNNLILRKIQYTKTDSSVHIYITALRS